MSATTEPRNRQRHRPEELRVRLTSDEMAEILDGRAPGETVRGWLLRSTKTRRMLADIVAAEYQTPAAQARAEAIGAALLARQRQEA